MTFFDHFKAGGKVFRIILLSTSIFCGHIGVDAQENSNSNQPSPTPSPVSTPVPVARVITEADAAIRKTEEIKNSLDENPGTGLVESELPELKNELDARVVETTSLLSVRPSLETLRNVEQDWLGFAKKISGWNDTLKTRVGVYEDQLKELQALGDVWRSTMEKLTRRADENSTGISSNSNIQSAAGATQAAEIPREVIIRIEQVLDSIEKTRKLVEEKQGALLTLQARVAREEERVNDTLETIKDVRNEALSHLFVQDSPVIWNAVRQTDADSGIRREIVDSLTQQAAALGEYTVRKSDRFVFHGVIFITLVFVLFRFGRKSRNWAEEEPRLKRVFTVFELPFVSALILSIMLSTWLYPQAPRMLSAVLGALALIPGVIFLRRVLDRPFFPILHALVIFYFVDQLRAVTASLSVVSRLLFVMEILGAVIFLIWFLRSKRLSQKIPVSHHRVFTLLKKSIPFVLAAFSVALAANIFGYVSLSTVIGNGVLGSAYVALILYAALKIIESLIIFLMRVRPLSSLYMIREHGALIERKIVRVLQWAAIILWVTYTLNLFSIRQPLFSAVKGALFAELAIGSIAISLADVIILAVSVWLAFAVSRLIRFILNEDIYPRVNLAGGVPYAISTMLHYVVLVAGFFFGLAALGIDLTKFTILAGAVGVGLGFGLQNIVNNFVSGIILLFERPVKVNDLVQIGTHQGDLKQIGLRASVLRTVEGSEVIVPNGQLISEEVTNWTFSDRQRRIEVNVGVAYGTDPRTVMDLITKKAEENTELMKDPAPRTLFVGFGESSLDFQLRAWTESADRWIFIKSDLTLAIHDILTENDIEIPFPQRDLNVRNLDIDVDQFFGKPKKSGKQGK